MERAAVRRLSAQMGLSELAALCVPRWTSVRLTASQARLKHKKTTLLKSPLTPLPEAVRSLPTASTAVISIPWIAPSPPIHRWMRLECLFDACAGLVRDLFVFREWSISKSDVMGSTCFDLGAQIARAAAAGVAERETEMDSFGVGDVKDKLRELPKVVEDMPLDPFIEDITVTAAPVSAPTDAPGPPDRDAILAERGPAGAAGPALAEDSLDRSDNLELPSEQLGSCTLSISALTLVSEMTRELMGEEKDGKCDAVPHRFAANQTGRCPRLQGRGLFAKTGLEEKVRFAFMMYDEEQDGSVSREELSEMLRAMAPYLRSAHRDAHLERVYALHSLHPNSRVSFDELMDLCVSGALQAGGASTPPSENDEK
eukprot:g22568.t1